MYVCVARVKVLLAKAHPEFLGPGPLLLPSKAPSRLLLVM